MLYPRRGFYFASDRARSVDGSPVERMQDIVFSALTEDTERFLELLPDDPCDSLLDLGTGAGVAALIAARSARHVWAVDITERAARFAEFNQRLNGGGQRHRPAGRPVRAGARSSVRPDRPPSALRARAAPDPHLPGCRPGRTGHHPAGGGPARPSPESRWPVLLPHRRGRLRGHAVRAVGPAVAGARGRGVRRGLRGPAAHQRRLPRPERGPQVGSRARRGRPGSRRRSDASGSTSSSTA